MRKLFVLLAISLLIFGCNQGQRQKETLNQQEIDKNKIIDSLSKIAWGDALFGMSIEEVKRTNAFQGSKIKKNSTAAVLIMPKERSKILGLHFQPADIMALFDNDSLVIISINSKNVEVWNIKDLVSDIHVLRAKFTEKYGEPEIDIEEQNHTELNILDFLVEGENKVCYCWKIGNKVIALSVFGEFGGDLGYRVLINQFNMDAFEKQTKEIERYQF